MQETKIGANLLMFLFRNAVRPPYRSRQKAAYVTTGITFRENTLKKLIWIRLRKIPNSDVSSFVPEVFKCSSEPLIRLVLGCSLGLRIIQDPII